ncbi:SPFH domain-containing protein [Candidatus Pacearchaeota archaeon]|nr:SPFH domain-containing protein [Candidatus Pacearchaeota archaeon]
MESSISQIMNWLGNLFRWWIMVAPWEQAVRVRRGKVTKLLGAGIHLRIPGIDRLYRESIRLRTIDTGVQTVSTMDNHAVTLRARIRFRIDNYLTVFETLHHAEDTIIDLAMSEIAEQVRAQMHNSLTPSTVEEAVEKSLNADQYGLTGLGISITDFAFVKTFRIISGDNRYQRGLGMDYSEIEK